MKKNYLTWNKDTVTDEVIFEHLRILSNGKIDLKQEEYELRDSNQLVKKRKNNNGYHKQKNYRKKRN